MSKATSLPGANGAEDSPLKTGRSHLEKWDDAQPDNYFTSDINLQRSLEFLWGTAAYKEHLARLYRFGAVAATAVDPLVRTANETAELPRLARFDALGQRIESVQWPAAHHEAGRQIYGSGVMSVLAEPGHNLLSLALFYLSAQNGEAGHNCPLACTAGVIKTLQNVAAPALRDRYLPRLLDSEYDSLFHGAQFLTEVQGGSDVGANATQAGALDPNNDVWLLNGEKWFCSNVTADLALVTARVPGQGEGTAGLGLFLVPRRLPDGQLNGLYIQRLKDKLGTRSLATAEVEFRDAVAYLLGEPTDGFRNIMTHVINTSRFYNSLACAGAARRAYVVARTYAQHRYAFGRPIIHFPLVQQSLTRMRADHAALLAGSLRLIKMWDEVETGQADDNVRKILRLGVNLNKYRTAVLAHEIINLGIETLGGNGAIETFSVLPRLLRDNVVYENWEGPHNVLLAQAQRDMRRYAVHEPFLAYVRQLLGASHIDLLRREGVVILDALAAEMTEVLALSETDASLFFRDLMDRLIDIFYLACLSAEAAWTQFEKQDRSKQRLAEFFFYRRVARKDPAQIPDYADRVSRLCAEFRPGKIARWPNDEETA